MALFSVKNSERITNETREYLVDNTTQMSESIDSALTDGYSNIKILSDLVSRSLTGPEFDITDIQGLIQDSVFDFMEFADAEGMDHNITGGVSDATDRQYYLDAKAPCAGKIAASLEAAILGYNMFLDDREFPAGDGILVHEIEEIINNVGTIAKDGKAKTNEEIINIMIKK